MREILAIPTKHYDKSFKPYQKVSRQIQKEKNTTFTDKVITVFLGSAGVILLCAFVDAVMTRLESQEMVAQLGNAMAKMVWKGLYQ